MSINKKAVITQVHTGDGYQSNDNKYIYPAYERLVTLKHKLNNGFYITDFFNPDFINIKNDYIHYGFLIINLNNITFLENAPEYGTI